MKKLFILLTVFVLTFSIGYSFTYYDTFSQSELDELKAMMDKQKEAGKKEIHATWTCVTEEKQHDFGFLCAYWAKLNLYSVVDVIQVGNTFTIIMLRLY